MIDYTRNTINVGDIELSYYRKGSGKKALILLHGNSEDATIFIDYLNNCLNDYKIYAIDLRGHGHSGNGKGHFTIKDMAIDIMRFINLKPFSNASIVGYSDGANIAMYLAKIAPSLVEKLVLISGNLFVKALSSTFVNSTKRKYKFIKPFSFISKKAKTASSKLALMLNNIGVYSDDLNKFNFPTLVIDAENDIIEKDHTSLIAKSIPNAQHITIEKTNHYNLIKNPLLFTAIDDFLK